MGEYDVVYVIRDIIHRGVTYPSGTVGTIVHDHGDGVFEVFFNHPEKSVLTLRKHELESIPNDI